MNTQGEVNVNQGLIKPFNETHSVHPLFIFFSFHVLKVLLWLCLGSLSCYRMNLSDLIILHDKRSNCSSSL